MTSQGLILGPADADHFRAKVGRYGDRWYVDPLPGCDLAPASEGQWPSISTVKKAAGQDWSFVALKRMAHATTPELERFATLDPAQRYETAKMINRHGLNVAAGRGTILHWWGEDMLHRRAPREVDDFMLAANGLPAESLERALRYLPAFRQFFDTYQPELIATEYVTIHRTLHGVGYGGTPDGLWLVDGKTYAYDFKSRSEDGDHAAYPEEAAQIAAGVRAEYMIIEGSAGAERRRVPEVDGGMIVSLKPDGVRIYPVDVDRGWRHWQAMHAWWVARRNERDAIGRAQPARSPNIIDSMFRRPRPDVAAENARDLTAEAQAALVAAIKRAGSYEALAELWAAAGNQWKPEHTELAALRKAELVAERHLQIVK